MNTPDYISIDMSRALPYNTMFLTSPSKPEAIYKAVAGLFQGYLNDSYFEKWRQSQEEIAVLRREIFALKRSKHTNDIEKQGLPLLPLSLGDTSPVAFRVGPPPLSALDSPV